MKKCYFLFFLILTGIFFVSTNDYAWQDEIAEELKLYVGETTVLPVDNPNRIIIGNPNIVDVSDVVKNEITLVPKSTGTTSLTFWDNFGEQFYKVKVFAENVTAIKQRVDNLLSKLNLPGVYTKAEEEEGKVLLLGSIKNAQDRERISLVLASLKDKIVDLIVIKEEEAVVEINVEVLELSKDAESTLGFTGPLHNIINLTEVGSPGISALGEYWTKLFRIVNIKRDAFTWTLDALIQEGKAKVLSRPKLACQSGKEAELLVGGEKPIFTTEVASAGGTGSSVEYKEYGLKLKIKPSVTEDNRIKVALNVDISEVQTAETIGPGAAPTASAYPLTKRTVSTELYLNNGQTLAIGGLMKQKREEDIERTPFISEIPIIGALFRKKTTKTGGGAGERGDTELFITLTPSIVGVNNENSEQPKEIQDRAVSFKRSSSENEFRSINEYIRIIQQRILENMTYPLSAKQAGYSGTVKLSLLISSEGQLEDVIVKGSSGYKILDDNAVTVTKQLVSYPPLPSSAAQKEIWIDVPIVYRLD